MQVLSAYLTESLITEVQRVKKDVSYYDMFKEIKAFSRDVKQSLQEGVQICDGLDQLIQ